MILSYVIFGTGAFAALLIYAWMEGLWDWSRAEKGLLDLDAEAEIPPKYNHTNDINFIEGKRK